MFVKASLVHKTSLEPSFVATVSTERYRLDFCPFRLVAASLGWLVLGLAIVVVNPFYYHSAEQLRMHIKLYISA